MHTEKKYHSYLLRMWIDDVNGKQVWRISLEEPISRERRGFASLRDLCTYLESKMRLQGKTVDKSATTDLPIDTNDIRKD